MINIFFWEIRKLFVQKSSIILCTILMTFPLLVSMYIDYSNNSEIVIYKGNIESKKTSIEMMETWRYTNKGIIDECWINELEKEIQNLNLETMDLYNTMISDTYWDCYNSYFRISQLANDQSTPENIKKEITENELLFGPYSNWLQRFDIFSITAILYCFICIFFFSKQNNQNVSYQLDELIFTTRFGYRTIKLINFFTSLFISIVLDIISYYTFDLSTRIFFPIDSGTTTAFMTRGIQIFNFSKLNTIAFVLMLTGGIICTYTSYLFSCLTKKPIASLLTSITFFLFPLLFSSLETPFLSIFPLQFLLFNANGELLQNPWLIINNTAYRREFLCPFIYIVFILLTIYPVIVRSFHIKLKKTSRRLSWN